MRLGFICNLSESDFRFAAENGFPVVEWNVNEDDIQGFLARTAELEGYMRRYKVTFSAIGRSGRDRISDDPAVRQKEQRDAERLIDWCAAHQVPTFVVGPGPDSGRSLEENCKRALDVLGHLVDYGKGKGVRVAMYNCHWGNFAFAPQAWEHILPALPDLGIKFDPSHVIYDGRDYLKEARDWGHRFYHFHAKGSLVIDGQRFDDPPAGMDVTNWGALLAVLHKHRYPGDIVIEPHSETWSGERYYPGILIAKRHLEPFLGRASS